MEAERIAYWQGKIRAITGTDFMTRGLPIMLQGFFGTCSTYNAVLTRMVQAGPEAYTAEHAAVVGRITQDINGFMTALESSFPEAHRQAAMDAIRATPGFAAVENKVGEVSSLVSQVNTWTPMAPASEQPTQSKLPLLAIAAVGVVAFMSLK